MAVDNFDIIIPLMHFECPGDMYFIEIIRRGKDHGETGERLICDYHIRDFKQMEKRRAEIIERCEQNGARAYIRLNQRNVSDANIYAQIEMLNDQLVRNRTIRAAMRHGHMEKIKNFPATYRSATKIYGSVLGKYSSEERPTMKWTIDIDTDRIIPGNPAMDSLEHIADTYSAFITSNCVYPGDSRTVEKEYCRIPSKTGLHLVTRPFYLGPFNEWFGKDKNGDSYVKEDGITNLYIAD